MNKYNVVFASFLSFFAILPMHCFLAVDPKYLTVKLSLICVATGMMPIGMGLVPVSIAVKCQCILHSLSNCVTKCK